jgi:TolA-binding protein
MVTKTMMIFPRSITLIILGYTLILADAQGVSSAATPDSRWKTAEVVYKAGKWGDAEDAYLDYARLKPKPSSADLALVKAGICRVKRKDDIAGAKLFSQVIKSRTSDTDAVGLACEQLYGVLWRTRKESERLRLLEKARERVPGHLGVSRIHEAEADAQLVAGRTALALQLYQARGVVLSPGGTNVLFILKSCLSPSASAVSDIELEYMRKVAVLKADCMESLFLLLSKRRDGWRAQELRAEILNQGGKFDESIKAYKRLLMVRPGDSERLNLKMAAVTGLGAGHLADACELYRVWLRQYPKSSLREEAICQYAETLWIAGKVAESKEMLEAFLSDFPQSRMKEGAQQMLRRIRSDEETKRKKVQLVNVPENIKKNPLADKLAQAEQVAKTGRHQDAVRVFSEFSRQQSNPLWGRAWYGLGKSLYALRQTQRALDVWGEVARLATLFTNISHVAECQGARGNIFLEDFGDPGRALIEYQSAYKHSTKDSFKKNMEENIALCQLATGASSDALPVFEKRLADATRKDDASDIMIYRRLVRLCNHSSIQRTGLRSSTGETTRRLLGSADILFAAGKVEKADILYLRAAEDLMMNPELLAETEMQHARCLALQQKYDQSVQVYESFMERHKKTTCAPLALIRAGVLCAGPMNNNKKACRFFSYVASHYPKTPYAEQADIYIATLAWWGHEWGRAETLFQDFIKRYPESAMAQKVRDVCLPSIQKRQDR